MIARCSLIGFGLMLFAATVYTVAGATMESSIAKVLVEGGALAIFAVVLLVWTVVGVKVVFRIIEYISKQNAREDARLAKFEELHEEHIVQIRGIEERHGREVVERIERTQQKCCDEHKRVHAETEQRICGELISIRELLTS